MDILKIYISRVYTKSVIPYSNVNSFLEFTSLDSFKKYINVSPINVVTKIYSMSQTKTYVSNLNAESFFNKYKNN